MPSRNSKTSIDYVVIALNPILIVAMIASLVYFLTLCFYEGGLLHRLNYILLLFIVAAVGIARIAIEEGRSRASAFAMALAAATLFSISTFIGSGLLLAIILLGLIWFLADRITIDCTVIDDQQDASGEGLLQGGLFGGSRLVDDTDRSLDGTTETVDAAKQAEPESDRANSLRPPRHRKQSSHRPGRWILYLALAAVPLYGLGQWILPAGESSRSSAISSLALYLGSSLMLLVTTSFLGMRRYLRQRGAEMPAGISVNWLGVGGFLVVALLFVCFLIPFPGQLLASLDFASLHQNEDLDVSAAGWGNEGLNSDRDDVPQAEDGEQHSPGKQNDQSTGRGQPQGEGTPGDNGKGQSSDGKQGDQRSNTKGDGQDKQDGSKQDGSKHQNAEQNEPGSDGGNKVQRKNENASKQDDDTQNTQSASPSNSKGSSGLREIFAKLAGLLRYFILAGLILIVTIYALRHWEEISRWVRGFLGGDKQDDVANDAKPSAAMSQRTVPRFTDFRDPLQDPTAQIEQAVVTTFAAMEAWSREHGLPREDETTPTEFAKLLATEYPTQSRNVQHLAEMYNLVVYGNRRVNPAQRQTIAAVWQFMVQCKPPAGRSEATR